MGCPICGKTHDRRSKIYLAHMKKSGTQRPLTEKQAQLLESGTPEQLRSWAGVLENTLPESPKGRQSVVHLFPERELVQLTVYSVRFLLGMLFVLPTGWRVRGLREPHSKTPNHSSSRGALW